MSRNELLSWARVTRASRWRWAASLSGVLLISWSLATTASAAPPTTTTQSYSTAGQYEFTVPEGVSSISVIAVGAAGAGFGNGGSGASAGGLSSGQPAPVVVPVASGEQLYVSVGGPGHNPFSSGVPGGFGGGGSAGPNAGGGGGASSVTTGGPLPSSALVVAGGGGGSSFNQAGGNAGSNGGQCGGCGGFGGAGSQSAGGAGGAAAGSGGPGTAGQFGLGGAGGGSGGGVFFLGGGGGGGGYFGGGGGGGGGTSGGSPTPDGGGGGGGSSYVTPLATNAGSGAAPTATSAEVTITYVVPTATESASSIAFPGTVPLDVASTEQPLNVTNNGSAPLIISGVLLSGTDPGDYLVNLAGCAQAVAAGASCTLEVRFVPQAQGSSSATLTLLTNAAAAPAAVGLSGNGGALPTGPTGLTGPQGLPGKNGAPGKVEVITCKLVKKGHKTTKHCTGKLESGTVKFTVSGAADIATLSRHHVVYARGESIAVGGRSELFLSPRRTVRAGWYTLTLRSRRDGHWTTHSERVAIG